MQYYILDVLGSYDEDKFCITDDEPEGLEDKELALEYGGSLKSEYPKNPYEVTMRLDEDSPKHIKLGSFISNTSNYFMVSNEVVDELKNFDIGIVEFWPFALINHKGRVHSRDYNFVCPVKPFDAINEALCEFRRDKNGVALRIRKVVLDNKKLESAPDLFRVNDIRLIAVSEPLMKVLTEKYTNFVFDKAEQV